MKNHPPPTPSASAPSPIMVGRDDELALIVKAAENRPSLGVIEGEPGIGKTRLVEEAISRLGPGGPTIMLGRAAPVREPFPLGPVVHAVREAGIDPEGLGLSPVAGALRPLLPEIADRLPPPCEPLGSSAADRHRVLRAVRELLESCGPALLILEDLHWADAWTLDLLALLLTHPLEDLCLIVTFRREDLPEEMPVPAILSRAGSRMLDVRIALRSLGLPEGRELIGAILETEEVSEGFARFLLDRTGGLPFAVEEVLRLLQERGDVLWEGRGWARRMLREMEVPLRLRDSILERVARLPRDGRALAEAAAVLASPSSQEEIARVAGLPASRARVGLATALRTGMLRGSGDGRIALRHALAEQAIRGSMEVSRRRRMHLRAASLLEGTRSASPGRLAHHLRSGGSIRKWTVHAEKAAEVAIAAGADSEAVEFLLELFRVPGVPRSTRARVATKLARAALQGWRLPEAAEALGELLEREGGALPGGVRGEIRAWYGLLLRESGDSAGAFSQRIRSLRELRGRPREALRVLKNLAVPLSVEGHVDDHLSWLDDAVRIARSIGDPLLRRSVLTDRAGVLLCVGDPDAWKAVADVPRTAATPEESRELVRGQVNFAMLAALAGHDARAAGFVAGVRDLRDAPGFSRVEPGLACVEGYLDWTAGRWEDLEARLRRARRQAEDTPHVASLADTARGLLLLARSPRDPEAGELLRGAADAALRAGALPTFQIASAGLARALLAEGDRKEAQETAGAAVRLARDKGIWVWASEPAVPYVQALVAAGEVDRASALVQELNLGMRGRAAPAAQAALMTASGLLAVADGHRELAARRFGVAERLWSEMARPLEVVRAIELRGDALVSDGDAHGGQVLVEALRRFDELGAAGEEARVRGRLRDHGIRLPYPFRGGRRRYGDELSPREREVAALVADGLTNREIAGELFLSPRTVEDHVARILRKLGMKTRRDLRGLLSFRRAESKTP